jgi:hypothetical protein
MASDVQTGANPISGQMLLYVNPEPLDSARHAKLAMRASDTPFAFAAGQHFVPLHVGEFGAAAINYPIIFAGETKAPIAVMGLSAGENLFVEPDGKFRIGAYIPAYIRRYPFVVARDDQAQRMVVCIDRAFAQFTEDETDAKLFEDGQPTEFTKNCIEFCRQFDVDAQVTENFVKLLSDFDLLESRQTNFTPRLADGSSGEPQLVAEYFAVSEEKLKALSHNKLAQLRDSGALAQIYAHLVSLLVWERLIIETIDRKAPQPANA